MSGWRTGWYNKKYAQLNMELQKGYFDILSTKSAATLH